MNHLINYILLYKYYIINKYFIHLKKYRVVFKVNTSVIIILLLINIFFDYKTAKISYIFDFIFFSFIDNQV